MIIKKFSQCSLIVLIFFLSSVCSVPARAALQCTSLEVSSVKNSLSPINATVTLTLRNTSPSSAVIIKPALTFHQLQQDGSWQDVSDVIFVKPDANSSHQIASGINTVMTFQIQLFDDAFNGADKSTFCVTPHIQYFLQQDNLLPRLTSATKKISWQVDNPATAFGTNAFIGHDDGVQIHVNNNLLKGRLTLRSDKSTFNSNKMYLAGVLNKSDRSGWDSPLNKGASVIEYNDAGAIRAHPLHIYEVPFWNWELMQFRSDENAKQAQMEIWLRGWDLHQTGDWWIKNAFVVPQEKVKVLSTTSDRLEEGVSPAQHTFKMAGLMPSSNRSMVTYLGQDRSTQGNWRGNYGNESFILCAMQAPRDVVGGRILPKRFWSDGKKGEVPTAGVWSSWQGEFHYSVATGDAKEQVRHYIPPHQLTTNDKRALVNPLEGGRRYASWDDHGETHPFDWKGPDLLVHLEIPKGLHKLSFYFVDWDFADTFRPRASRLLIEEDTKDVKVLSSAYISHFGGGVYKTFAVHGPCKLRVHITKDASVCAVLSGIFLDEIQNNSLSRIGERAGVRGGPITSKVPLAKTGDETKVPLFKGGFRGISSDAKTLSNPQLKQAAFAAYIKSNPPANAAAAKARVQHLLDKGEVGLARLAIPAWLHRATAQSPATEISSYREAVTMFALRDSDYASDLAQQLVRHVLARGGSKVLLLKIGTQLMRLAELHQHGTLRSRAAYPVVVAYYRRLEGEFGVKGLGEEAAYNFVAAKAQCAGYHHARERRAIIEYQKYAQQWPKSIYAIKAHQKIIQLANVLCVPMERNARGYASIAADSAKALTRWLLENRDTEQIPTGQNDPHRELYFAVKQSVNQFAALSARVDGKSK